MLRPLTRLLLLLVLALSLAPLPLLDLLVLTTVLALGYRRSDPRAWRRLGSGVLRLRWLLLSIFVLYLGFTPGTPLSPWTPGFSVEGALEGARRTTVLLCLITAVYWLMAVTPVPQLVAALDQLLMPLRRGGLSTDRLTRRIGLTLAALDEVEADYQRLRSAGHRGLDLGAAWIMALEARAPSVSAATVSLPWPRWWEFALVVACAAGAWWWPT